MQEMRERVVMILSAIFEICLARVPTFLALGNPTLGWEIVAGDVAEQHGGTMTPDDVAELVTVFGRARRVFFCLPRDEVPASPPSELMNLIDQWLDATRQDNWAPAGGGGSSQPTTLVARPAPPASLENLFARFNLAAHASSSSAAGSPAPADAAQDWPPAHLAPTDAQLLNHPRIRERLAGVCWGAKGAMPDLPGDKPDPLCLRLFLGPIALFAAPVAFFTNKERQHWYRPSGDQSKMFGHVAGFLEYASDAFKSGKTMVLGLMTPFFPTLAEFDNLVRASGKPSGEVFNNHANMRRFGTAVMIRLAERNGVQGIQVAFFCPWDQHPWVRESWRLCEWCVRLWKDKLIAAVGDWAAEKEVTIHDGYTGGSTTVRKDRDHDSVEMCAGWLMRAVKAPEKTIPSANEEDDWEWEEVCFFKKLENWMPVDEDDAQAMDVDRDM
ncbi:hypothetical protein C8A01DRAFT_39361 [Parachaetomium inaequale]|uniref:Uncharacterized protein n=1 Tax=Parachaetomium inaequale TaxID=2588326 RepID=A0AAN6PDW8_9PEZI|nr:hypothetical protein C8A01DRAFT_39361 [Parachaetomium inaequale]